MRIVSLLPSATEIICCMGLREQLVGVTHECDYPASVKGLPVVTQSFIPEDLDSAAIDAMVRSQLSEQRALYSLRQDVLEALKPDLIVSQALCDVCAVAASEVEQAACSLPGRPKVINLEPARLEEVFATIAVVGEAAAQPEAAAAAIARLQARVSAVCDRSDGIAPSDRPRVAMLEWLDPLFNAGHWTPQLVQMAGGNECLGNPFEPSTRTSWEQLTDSNADVIFIAQCGFDAARSLRDVALLREQPRWQALKAVQSGRVFLADGNAYFSRSGPRLVDSLELLAHALHPQVHPLPVGLSAALQLTD
ncbi:MAG: ABC transporter substrate-binding protein [Pseudomonadota bacterium]